MSAAVAKVAAATAAALAGRVAGAKAGASGGPTATVSPSENDANFLMGWSLASKFVTTPTGEGSMYMRLFGSNWNGDTCTSNCPNIGGFNESYLKRLQRVLFLQMSTYGCPVRQWRRRLNWRGKRVARRNWKSRKSSMTETALELAAGLAMVSAVVAEVASAVTGTTAASRLVGTMVVASMGRAAVAMCAGVFDEFKALRTSRWVGWGALFGI